MSIEPTNDGICSCPHYNIQLLEPKFSMRILLFLRDRPPTSLSEIYDAVSYGTNMPRKLESLRDGGLIDMRPCGRAVYVSLTDAGRDVASKLDDITRIIEDNTAKRG